jgi:hypothetical protein
MRASPIRPSRPRSGLFPRSRRIAAVALGIAALALTAHTANADSGTESWSFDLTTTGNDVFWTSPTAVKNDAAHYIAEYLITLVEVQGTWGPGFPTGPIDVTDEIPEEDRSGTVEADGPPPIVLFDDTIVYPEPPEDPSVSADLAIYLDAAGHGRIDVTNVFLGSVVVDIGFGPVTVNITSIRVAGTVDATAIDEGIPGDLNGDGVVNVADLLILFDNWGSCADCDDCLADLNGDCEVNVGDLLILFDNWG